MDEDKKFLKVLKIHNRLIRYDQVELPQNSDDQILLDILREYQSQDSDQTEMSLQEKKKVIPLLLDGLIDEDKNVRKYSKRSLVLIGEPAVPALIEALKDENWYVQEGVAWALGKIGEPALATFNEAYGRGDATYELAEIFFKALNEKLSKEKFDKGCIAPPKKKPDDLKRRWTRKPQTRPRTQDPKPETRKRCIAGG